MPQPWGVAPDPAAPDLLPAWLGVPARLAGRLEPGAARALHLALGSALGGITYHIALRTHLIDEGLREALAGGTRQVVLLGAGLDNRAVRMPELAGTRLFEVDHPETLAYKEARLIEAGRVRPANVTVIGVDFEKDILDRRVLDAGLSAAEPSFWIWEGVTIYLTRPAIAATLSAVARASAPGSRLALTYTRPERFGGRALWSAATIVARAIGEPVRGAMTEHELVEELERADLRLLSDVSPRDAAHEVWPTSPPGIREWERVVIAQLTRSPGWPR
jgi:methyltransferase (TIGR00027 family)